MTEKLGSGLSNTDRTSEVRVKTPRLNKPWNVSNQGIAFMAEWESGIYNGTYRKMKVSEGLILKVYDDGTGLATVGLGHLVLPKDNLKIGDMISIEKAREFARIDFAKVEKPINARVKV